MCVCIIAQTGSQLSSADRLRGIQERGISPAVEMDDATRSVRVRNDADAVERVLGGQAASLTPSISSARGRGWVAWRASVRRREGEVRAARVQRSRMVSRARTRMSHSSLRHDRGANASSRWMLRG